MAKRKHPDEGEQLTTATAEIFRSAPIEDRSSTFIGLFSPTLKPKELQSLEEIKSASHKILGWRKESNQQFITKATQYLVKSDDDGERYGGKRIEKVLASLRAEGACVVARWYGGVMLGPVRFDHIEAAAKEAIEKWRTHEAEVSAKKRKLEQDNLDHARLSKTLTERDQSIEVLRHLAADKEAKLKEDEDQDTAKAQQPEPASSRTRSMPDYQTLAVERLRTLEKARDATIAFMLKRIDKAEAQLQGRTEKPP